MARSSTPRDLIVGLLFFGGLAALAWVTTQLRNWPGMGTRQYLNVLFEDVYGVRKEDSVLVHGTRYGRVSRIQPIERATWNNAGRDLATEGLVAAGSTFVPNVLLVIELEHEIELHSGYTIYAEDSNLLGGKVVTIVPGPPMAAVKEPGPDEGSLDPTDPRDIASVVLVGTPKPHPLNAIGRLVEDNIDGVNEIVENIRVASRGLTDENEQGIIGYLLNNKDARAKAENVVATLDDLANQAKTPNTLFHDLFYEGPFRSNLLAASDGIKAFVDSANDSDSVIGALVTPDHPWKQDVDAILTDGKGLVADARSFMDKANRPGSLLGRLTDDGPDSLGAKTDQLVDDVAGYVRDATTNQDSLIYNLAYGDLGTTAKSALTKIDEQVGRIGTSILDPIENSTGALGYLINDPESKQKLERLFSATLGIIEDAREAAPVTSLGSFIFGGF